MKTKRNVASLVLIYLKKSAGSVMANAKKLNAYFPI